MPWLHVQRNKTGFERTYQCPVKRVNMVIWLVCTGRTCTLIDLTTPNFVLNIPELKLSAKNILRWKCGSVYVHGGHLGRVTKINFIKIRLPLPKKVPH